MATMTLPETETKESKKSTTKYVYFFGGGKADGNGKMKDVLGGKGAGLAEMTNAGLPVPPGFTIQTEACREYMRGQVSPEMDRHKKALQHFLNQNVYRHFRVLIMSEKARRFIADLFKAYSANPSMLPPRFQEWAKLTGVPRAVADYIAGMTDRYCQDEYRKLFYPFENIL